METVRIEKPQLLHVHGMPSLSFTAFLRCFKQINTPIVFHDHFGNIELKHNIPYWYKVIGHHFVAQYVGVYSKLAQDAIAAGMKKEQISVIENALDLERLSNAKHLDLHRAFDIPEVTLIGVVVAGLRFEKGIDVLVDALSLINSDQPFVILVCGGERQRGYLDLCQQKVAVNNLQHRIIFLGERQDALSVIRSADFAIMPSRSESGPLTLIEYGYFGLPIIATPVGSIGRRYFDLGIDGFVPPDNVSALAEALMEILSLSDEQLQKRRDHIHKVTLEEFDIRRIMHKWYAVYESAAEK